MGVDEESSKEGQVLGDAAPGDAPLVAGTPVELAARNAVAMREEAARIQEAARQGR